MSTPNYEFDRQQNRIIADLAKKMTGVGLFLIIAGVTLLLAAAVGARSEQVANLWILALAGAFFVITGTFTFRGGRSFRRIVDSEGNDIAHTMAALTQLDRFFTVNFWLVFAFVLLVISALVGVPSVG